MANPVRVEYDRNRCIGAGNCAAAAPHHFVLKGEKAELLDGALSGEVFVKTVAEAAEREEVVEAARQCPVNAIAVRDAESGEELVKTAVESSGAKEVDAEYDDEKEFVLDDAGYFLIRIDRKKRLIEAAFCGKKNEVELVVRGKTPIAIYHTILAKEKLALRPEHAAYLGRELQKAYLALENGLEYVQDDPLDISLKAGKGE